jgi:DUF1009 family protein
VSSYVKSLEKDRITSLIFIGNLSSSSFSELLPQDLGGAEEEEVVAKGTNYSAFYSP